MTSAAVESISIVGINHDTAPLHIRERFSLPDDKLPDAMQIVRSSAAECVILSTCNRLEIYALLMPGHDPLALFSDIFSENLEDVRPYLYQYSGIEAIQHLFTVAAGIDSLVLGEVQILGQVQRAWQAAHKEHAVGSILSQLFHKAVALGKRVHSETHINRRPASVSYAAVVLARQIFGDAFKSSRVLVLGTGEVGEGVARCLYEHGLHATVVAHRQISRAHSVARRYEADVALWEELPDRLAQADIVISSTSAPHTILQKQHIEDAVYGRADKPLYLIDLAVPRDIDPEASTVPGVHLHNIDDLQEVVRTTMQERQSALPAIHAMITEDSAKFVEWLRARSSAPTIRDLRVHSDEITQAELQWALAKLPDLTPRERQVVEAMASRITGKLLHGPIQWLKSQSQAQAEADYTIESLSPQELADLFYSEAIIIEDMESE